MEFANNKDAAIAFEKFKQSKEAVTKTLGKHVGILTVLAAVFIVNS